MKAALLALALAVPIFAADPPQNEPSWVPGLAYQSAPGCPTHQGTREGRSEVSKLPGGQKAFMSGVTITSNNKCSQELRLVVEGSQTRSVTLQSFARALKDAQRRDVDRPTPEREFEIIDSTSDGSSLLLQRRGSDSWRNHDYRDVEIGTISTSLDSFINWINVWDLLKWQDCDATVNAQGFDNIGRPVLHIRPSVWSGHQHQSCVQHPELWAVDLKHNNVERLHNETKISRNGKLASTNWITCKGDPDVVGECFTLHGRLFAANGAPSLRILRIGTKRILGVSTETVPENVPLQGFENEVIADFVVCPFSKQKPGEMQMVCVESAKQVVTVPPLR